MRSHVLREVIKVSIFPRYSPLGSNECVFKNRVHKQFLWCCSSGVILFMHNYADRVHKIYRRQPGTFEIRNGVYGVFLNPYDFVSMEHKKR